MIWRLGGRKVTLTLKDINAGLQRFGTAGKEAVVIGRRITGAWSMACRDCYLMS
jgi:hypothetical protein